MPSPTIDPRMAFPTAPTPSLPNILTLTPPQFDGFPPKQEEISLLNPATEKLGFKKSRDPIDPARSPIIL